MYSKRKFCLFLLLALFYVYLLFSPKQVYAVTTSVSNVPSTIGSDPFTITVSVSGASNGTNYLRIDLYREGTTNNYFGETYNNTDWYSGSDGLQYFPITIASGSWSGLVQGRFGSPSATDYDGTGTYKLRVRRYTASGNYTSSEANDSAVVIAVSFPTNTPIPTPSPTPTTVPTPTKTPTPTPTAKPAATSTPKPASTNTPVPTVKATATSAPTITMTPTKTEAKITTTSAVLGEKIEVPPKVSSHTILPQVFMGLGATCLLGCGILVFRAYKKGKIVWHE